MYKSIYCSGSTWCPQIQCLTWPLINKWINLALTVLEWQQSNYWQSNILGLMNETATYWNRVCNVNKCWKWFNLTWAPSYWQRCRTNIHYVLFVLRNVCKVARKNSISWVQILEYSSMQTRRESEMNLSWVFHSNIYKVISIINFKNVYSQSLIFGFQHCLTKNTRQIVAVNRRRKRVPIVIII